MLCYLASGILDIMSGDMPKGIKIQRKHLEALIELHNVTQTFARNIQHLFSDSELRVLMDTLKAVYLPYDSFKQRWEVLIVVTYTYIIQFLVFYIYIILLFLYIYNENFSSATVTLKRWILHLLSSFFLTDDLSVFQVWTDGKGYPIL